MKRLLLVAVIGLILGKAFVSAMVSLSRETTGRTGHFALDKSLDSNMRLAPFVSDENPKPQIPTLPPFLFHSHGALPTTVSSQTLKTAKPVPPKKDKEKDKKDDDEKRKKKLEEEEAKKKLIPPKSPNVAYEPPVTPPTAAPGFHGPITPFPSPTQANPIVGGAAAVPLSTIAGWLEALVNRPTPALMTAFVTLYQQKKITTAQFYQVLSAMQKSPVLLARQDAVTAAEMQTNSQSFQILADESQTEIDGPTRAGALQGISAYASVSDLGILSQALASGDINAKLAASSTLNTVVQQFGVNKNPALAQSLFMPFVAILKSITISQVPAILQSNAQMVLNEISSLLGTAV